MAGTSYLGAGAPAGGCCPTCTAPPLCPISGAAKASKTWWPGPAVVRWSAPAGVQPLCLGCSSRLIATCATGSGRKQTAVASRRGQAPSHHR